MKKAITILLCISCFNVVFANNTGSKAVIHNISHPFHFSFVTQYSSSFKNQLNYFPDQNITEITRHDYDLAIGQPYQGGIIAYIYQPGDLNYRQAYPGGIIAAPFDQSKGILFFPEEYTDFPTNLPDNTNNLIQVLGNGWYAAKTCSDLKLNGYTDWKLPTKTALDLLYKSKDLIGGFSEDSYWSSSSKNGHPYYQWFNYGYQIFSLNINLKARVRAIRYF